MIAGEVPTPALALGNRGVILRHLNAIVFRAAEPGLSGRMLAYVSPAGQVEQDAVTELVEATRQQFGYAIGLAEQAWGRDILPVAGLAGEELRRSLESLPERVQDLVNRTARQVQELRQALDRFAAELTGRRPALSAADLETISEPTRAATPAILAAG